MENLELLTIDKKGGNTMENMVRIVIIDVSDVLGSKVYDEALFPIEAIKESSQFIQQYIDISKYRVITV